MSVTSLTAPRPAWIDRIRQENASVALQVAGIVAFALLTAIGAQIRLYLFEVPFTLQTVAVYGSGLFLGWRSGLLAQLLYLSLGMFFPVYAGDGFGPAYLLAAMSTGYLIGFPIAAAVTGLASKKWNSLLGSAVSIVVGSIAIFTCGVIWLHFAAGHATWAESIQKGWLNFLPFDLMKIASVALLYTGIRRIKN